MTLTEKKQKNIFVYYNHICAGKPEADDKLNDSNRELIKAYAEEFPEAVCYKFNVPIETGFFKPTKPEKLYNFCCDIIFNAASVNMEHIKKLAEEYSITGSYIEYKRLEKELNKANVIYFVWS